MFECLCFVEPGAGHPGGALLPLRPPAHGLHQGRCTNQVTNQSQASLGPRTSLLASRY